MKRAPHETHGVPEHWFAGPDADRIEVPQAGPDGYGAPRVVPRGGTIRPAHLPGLVVAVDDVLRPRR